MRLLKRIFPFTGLLCALVAFEGCQSKSTEHDPTTAAKYKAQFLLAEEPSAAVQVLELRAKLLARTADAKGEDRIVVAGTIGGTPNPWGSAEPNYPWVQGKARFFLADAEASIKIAGHTHEHKEGEECPFCANAARADAVAVIRFLDANGKQINIDMREIFEIKKEQAVVIQGAATITGENKDAVLIIDADGIFIRSSETIQ